jgi:hypothetical protein
MNRSHESSARATGPRGRPITSPAVRRSLLGLLLALLAAPVPAIAQGMGVIYYRSGSPTTPTYQVNGDGTGQRLVATTPEIQRPTSRADYPGGRLFFWNQPVGTVPATTQQYGNIMVWNQAGNTKPVTAFTGPLYTTTWYTRNKWSNDGQDTFFSFYVYDSATARYHVYRANVTAAEVADPSFQALAPGDARLEEVTNWSGLSDDYTWDRFGTRLYYLDMRDLDRRKVRVKVVGVGLTEDDDAVLFDQRVTGLRPILTVSASPTRAQLVFPADNPTTGAKGLISLDTTTGAWKSLITEPAINVFGLSRIVSPMFSPDGTGIAFGDQRYVKKGNTYVPGVYKMSADGGPTFLLTEAPSGGSFWRAPLGWTW